MNLHSLFTLAAVITLLLPVSFSTLAEEKNEQPQEGNAPVLVRIPFTHQAELNQFAMSLDIWQVNHEDNYLVAYVTDRQYLYLLASGYQVTIDQELTSQLKQDAQPLTGQTAGIPGFPCYRTVEETYESLAGLAAVHPGLVSWIDIGDSWEKSATGGASGYDLNTLVITNKKIPGPKPRLYLLGAIHAREYAAAELAARFAEYLVEQYNRDADITWLLDYYEVHLTPIANPDGRKIAEGGIYWRKNTNHTDGCMDPDLWGTDLNRNSSFKWGVVGASQNACDETFRGSAPASEAETQAIQDYAAGIFADQRGPADTDPAPADTPGVFISLHSYGEFVLYPWSWSADPAPNAVPLQTLGRKFGFYSGYKVCQSGQPGCIYQTSGNSDDWAYGELGVAAYTFEVGISFFESCAYFEEQVLREQFPTLVYALKAARLPYQNPAGPEVVNMELSAEYIAPGAGLNLSFSADDARFDSAGWGDEPIQSIHAARYSLDKPSWIDGASLTYLEPQDGVFDSPQEDFTASISTLNLTPGRHTIFVESQDALGNWGVPSAEFFWISEEKYQPDLEPDSQYVVTSPGSTISYNLIITNLGTQDDTFEIQVLGNSWPTNLSRNVIGPLLPGESADLVLEISIPGNVPRGALDQAVLLAASWADPEKITHAQITTLTSPPSIYFPQISK